MQTHKNAPDATAQALVATVGAVGSIGQALRDYLAAHGLTQAQLAKRLGVARVMVARTECGARRAPQALLEALAALEVAG